MFGTRDKLLMIVLHQLLRDNSRVLDTRGLRAHQLLDCRHRATKLCSYNLENVTLCPASFALEEVSIKIQKAAGMRILMEGAEKLTALTIGYELYIRQKLFCPSLNLQS